MEMHDTENAMRKLSEDDGAFSALLVSMMNRMQDKADKKAHRQITIIFTLIAAVFLQFVLMLGGLVWFFNNVEQVDDITHEIEIEQNLDWKGDGGSPSDVNVVIIPTQGDD